MQAGNAHYRGKSDLPSALPVFPLPAALLLPGARLIGIIQPSLDGSVAADGEPELCEVGCIGRVISFAESGDGRYLISLQGVCRFRIGQELVVKTPFRQCRIIPFLADLDEEQTGADVDR